jgi:tripartite ATP-independent transporter DctM subunit
MLSGEIMNRAGIVKDLMKVTNALVGRLKGGLGYVNILASMLFAGVTGSAVADTSALGILEIPMMTEAGYPKNYTCALTSASSVMGPIIPPSIPMIIYGMIAGVSIAKLFLAGVIPGLLIAVSLSVLNFYYTKRYNYPKGEQIPIRDVVKLFINAIPILILPLIILGGILSGLFTPTEAASVAVVYAFIIALVLYKMKIIDFYWAFVQAAKNTSIVMLICGSASIVTWLLTISMVPQSIANFVFGLSASKILILLGINIFLLIVGCVIDLVPALLILVPIMAPLAYKIGIDPIHFGVIVVCNLCLGLITPPVGTVLYVCSSIGKIKLFELARAIIPMILSILITLIIVTYCPKLIMLFPNLYR